MFAKCIHSLNFDATNFSRLLERKIELTFEDILSAGDDSTQPTRLIVRSCRDRLEFWMRRAVEDRWTQAAIVPSARPPPAVSLMTRPQLLIEGETACVKYFYAERTWTSGGSVETVVREQTALCLDVMGYPEQIGQTSCKQETRSS